MTDHGRSRRPAIDRAFKTVPYLTMVGLAGVAATCLLGFEEPNRAMLGFSAALLMSAPIAIGLHLSLTQELSGEEKRLWLRALIGRRASSAWSAYLSSANRADVARFLGPKA